MCIIDGLLLGQETLILTSYNTHLVGACHKEMVSNVISLHILNRVSLVLHYPIREPVITKFDKY